MTWLAGHRQQVVFLALLLAAGLATQWAYPRLNPQWIAYSRGESALARRDFDQAAQALARAVALGVRTPRTWLLLGQAHLAEGRLEPAREAFLELLRLRPGDGDAMQLLAGIDERLGQPRLALEVLAEQERVTGLDFVQLIRLGDLHQRLDNPAGAERAWRRALDQRPNSREVRLRLADLRAWNKDYVEAQRLLEAVLATHPGDTQARLRLGRVLGWQGSSQAAIAQYRLALGEKP